MWQVWLWDATNDSIIPCDDARYLTLWGEYADQIEAIEVRNDLQRDGCYAIIKWVNK